MKKAVSLSLVLGLAGCLLSNGAAIADETVISAKKYASNNGQTVDVKHHYANYRGTSGKEWKNTEGADYSKRSATHTSDVVHSDGTHSERRNHASHTISADGETHKITRDHKAVSPDGTVTEEHSSDVKTDNKGTAPSAGDMN